VRIPTAFVFVIVSPSILLSCGQQPPPTDVDWALGRTCFEAHQVALPPGSQYEGIAQASDNRITIRAMTGIKVESFSCSLASSGGVRALED